MSTVLVTGASSGIGQAVALYLAETGTRVYAGVRTEADGELLETSATGELTAVRLDVTRPSDVDAAAERIRANGGLSALVNNAGVYLGGPLELMTDDEIDTTYQVNVVGLLRMTRACLPMLRESAGRIVNISSISGLVALPGASVYAGSKHAVEAVTDALRVELSPFGIRVIAVEPGSIDTEIWRKALERDERRADDEPGLRELYRPLISVLEKIDRDPRGIPPEMVAAVVHEALTDDSPRNRYLVGSDAKFLSRLRWLPDGLRDGMIRGKIWRE